MSIGIIVYSETGNTYSVATEIKNKLTKKGHNVTIEQIELKKNSLPKKKDIILKKAPKIEQYDVVIFGSPVHAFTLAPAFKIYLDQIESLKYKKIACYVTQHLPYSWLGGNNAIQKMLKITKTKGAIILRTEVINWSNKKREQMIEQLASSFSSIL
ncbi:MAG: flavodoxin family protein [Bacilli bacterium]